MSSDATIASDTASLTPRRLAAAASAFCARAVATRHPAAGHEVGSPDPGAAVQVDRAAVAERAFERFEDLAHGGIRFRHAVVGDRVAQVGDLTVARGLRKVRLVRFDLAGLGQIDEAIDAGVHQLADALPGCAQPAP